MSNIRLWHSYLGLLTGPAILFFALTGAFQIFDLHESRGAYQPPSLLAKLGMLHKKQVFAEPRRRPRPPDAAPAAPPPAEAPTPLATLALKWCFLLVALSLAATAGLGIWIGLRAPRYKRTAWVLLLVGIAIPVGLALAA